MHSVERLLFSLTTALHGLLGGQDERCETGEGLRQLQERMLSMEKENKQSKSGTFNKKENRW